MNQSSPSAFNWSRSLQRATYADRDVIAIRSHSAFPSLVISHEPYLQDHGQGKGLIQISDDGRTQQRQGISMEPTSLAIRGVHTMRSIFTWIDIFEPRFLNVTTLPSRTTRVSAGFHVEDCLPLIGNQRCQNVKDHLVRC